MNPLKTSKTLRNNNSSPKTTKEKPPEKAEKRLWSIARKYKLLFDRKQVPKIAESEEDRKAVADAYLELETQRHRQLDARVYQSLTKMQRIRDTKIALEGTTEKERLRMIAWEVKTRTQPVIFLLGDSTIEMDIFHMHDGSPVRIVDGEDDKELTIEDTILTDSTIAILDSLAERVLTPEERKFLEEELIALLEGKSYKATELEALIDNVQADILSMLIREKRLVAVKRADGMIEFLTREGYNERLKDSEAFSQSIVLFPRKSTNGGLI
ncbi:MAG: hypothetical protein ACTSV6_03555 [Candidatus Heimdallarchaeota archaeon]